MFNFVIKYERLYYLLFVHVSRSKPAIGNVTQSNKIREFSMCTYLSFSLLC